MVRVADLLLRRFESAGELDLLVECARLLRVALILDPSESDSAERSLRDELLADALSALGGRTREPADLLEAAAHYRSAEQRAPGGRRSVLALKSVSARLGVVELTAELSELTLNQLVGDFRRAHVEWEPDPVEPDAAEPDAAEPGPEPVSESAFLLLSDAVLRQAEALPVSAGLRHRLVRSLLRQVGADEDDEDRYPITLPDLEDRPEYGVAQRFDDELRLTSPPEFVVRPEDIALGDDFLSREDFLHGDESAGSEA
jgi:hypothetical protein